MLQYAIYVLWNTDPPPHQPSNKNDL